MYCSECGKQLIEGVNFCQFCGGQVRQNDAMPNQQTALKKNQNDNTADQVILNFPEIEIEPVYFIEQSEWMFRYRSSEAPPPAWTSHNIGLMLTDTHLFVQSAPDFTTGDMMKGGAMLAGITATMMLPGIAVPIALAALGADKAVNKKSKIGYGRHEQFKRDVVLQKFAAGDAMWAERDQCQFIALRSRLMFKTFYYFVIIAKFIHISGELNYAVVEDCASDVFHDINKDTKNKFQKAGCVLNRDDIYKVRSEALGSIVGYDMPPVDKTLDDKWYIP